VFDDRLRNLEEKHTCSDRIGNEVGSL